MLNCHVNPSSGFRVPWDGQMEGGIKRMADGWTDMELQTVTFSHISKFSNAIINANFLVSFKLCIM